MALFKPTTRKGAGMDGDENRVLIARKPNSPQRIEDLTKSRDSIQAAIITVQNLTDNTSKITVFVGNEDRRKEVTHFYVCTAGLVKALMAPDAEWGIPLSARLTRG